MTGTEAHRQTPTGPALDDYGRSDGEWLKIDWSEHLHNTVVESSLGTTPVDCVELGDGPPLLLVHGLGGSWRNWLEKLPSFARSHRVVALDLPGFGTSPMPSEPITMSAFGDLVVAFADRLGLGPETALVGHSMGGLISTEAVTEAPERFSSVIAHPSLIDRKILWELANYALTTPGFIRSLDALYGYDSRERLAEIRIPTMVMWGRKDRTVPVRAAHAYAERNRGAELSIIEDTGHMVQMERPARFNREVEAFISGPAAA